MSNSLSEKVTQGMLIRFALPTIISTVFMGLYSTVDGVFVSRLVGTDALSAVNIVYPLIMVSLAVGGMFGTGVNAIATKKLGEGKEQEARENISLITLLAVLFSLVFMTVCWIFLEPLIYFLGSDESLYTLCRDYAIPSLVFLPLCILGMLFQMLFISIGKQTTGLVISMAGGIANIFLDYLLIAVFDMGIAGAAIATGIGYGLPSGIGFLYFLCMRKESLYLVKPKWDGSVVWKSCSNGMSEMVNSISGALVTYLFNIILMRLAGAEGVAAVTIILYSYSFMSTVYMGYAMGVAPLISFRYGKNDQEGLHKIFRYSMRLIGIVAIGVMILSQIGATWIVGVFAEDRQSMVYEMAVHGFRIFAFCFLFQGYNMFASSMFTALSDGKVSAILALFRNIIFITLMQIILAVVFGLDGVWWAVPAAEFLGGFMTVYYFKTRGRVYHYLKS